MPKDILVRIDLAKDDIELALTASFNGGPISVVVDDGSTPRSYFFSADPFFRRRDHYIAIGSLLFRMPNPLPANGKPVSVSVQFANMFPEADKPKKVSYRLELSSLRTKTNLFEQTEDLELLQSRSISILLFR